jgi:hypothetical protein
MLLLEYHENYLPLPWIINFPLFGYLHYPSYIHNMSQTPLSSTLPITIDTNQTFT